MWDDGDLLSEARDGGGQHWNEGIAIQTMAQALRQIQQLNVAVCTGWPLNSLQLCSGGQHVEVAFRRHIDRMALATDD